MLRFLSGTFLIIGAVIGGGIFAIPIISAKFGFLTTFFLIIASWFAMTKTGLYVLSLSISCPEKYNTYYSIVGKFLGEKVKLLTVFLFLWLFYFSLSSCISGCVSIFMSYLNLQSTYLSYNNISILFVLIFGSFIIISAKIIVRLNVVLVVAKIGLLLLAIGTLFSHHLVVPMESFSVLQKGGLSLFFVVINAFGFQFIIPSLVSYYGHDYQKQYKWMIITSTTMVLCLYVAWLYTIYAIIPMQGPHGLLEIYNSQNQLIAFNTSLFFHLHSKLMIAVLATFEAIAMFSSFFCISLSVFDFLLDLFKTQNRLLGGIVTFIPPLLLTLCYENMYVYAMSFAGYIAIIIEIIIPSVAKQKQYRRASV